MKLSPRIAADIVDVIDTRERSARDARPRTAYGVVDSVDGVWASVRISGDSTPSSGFRLSHPVPIGGRVRVVIDPDGDRYVDEEYSDIRGDGATDDTAAINAAIQGAFDAGGGEVVLFGRHVVSSSITMRAGVTLRGLPGAVIDASGFTSTDNVIEADGSVTATSEALSADAAEGDTALTVADESGFAADDWCRVSSTASTGSTSVPKGEIVRVASVAAGSIVLRDPLCDSYATADSAVIEKLDLVEGIVIEDLAIEGPSSASYLVTGIDLNLCLGPRIRGVRFRRTHSRGLQLSSCVFSDASDLLFEDISGAGLAYGVAVVGASQDTTLEGLRGYRLRHLVTHGGASGTPGVPRRSGTSNSTISQAIEAGFDAHPGAQDIAFIGCHVHGSDGDGITIQASRFTVEACTVRDVARHGILLSPLSTALTRGSVVGCSVHRAVQRGILLVATSGYSAGLITLSNNVITDTTLAGIEATNSPLEFRWKLAISGNSIRSKSSAVVIRWGDVCAVTGNIIHLLNAATFGVYFNNATKSTCSGNAILCDSSSTTRGVRLSSGVDCTIIGNTVSGASIGVLDDASSSNCVIMGNNLRGLVAALSLTGSGHITQTAAADPYNKT